ncbi:MAG: succinate dehydrogenase, cytochrome b556 subunit [Pseudomonadota bacterium]
MADQIISKRPTFVPDHHDDRPLSPHLQIWGWTITMASSIAQRATGIALYAGSLLFVAWLTAAALGEEAFNFINGILGSPLGLIILIGFTWAQMFHMSKGILHLVWDGGHLLSKGQGKKAATVVFAMSALLTIIIWAVALGLGG